MTLKKSPSNLLSYEVKNNSQGPEKPKSQKYRKQSDNSVKFGNGHNIG